VRWEEGEKMNEKKWKRRYEKCWMIATDEEDLTGLFFVIIRNIKNCLSYMNKITLNWSVNFREKFE
jgi:hypothetical protein